MLYHLHDYLFLKVVASGLLMMSMGYSIFSHTEKDRPSWQLAGFAMQVSPVRWNLPSIRHWGKYYCQQK